MGDDCRGSRVAWLAKDEGRRRAMLASARSRAATLTLKESTCHQYPPCSPNCQLVRTRWHLDHTRRPEGDRLAEAAPVSCEPWPEARRLQAARGVKGWSEGRSRAMVASFACIIGVLRWGLTDDGYSSRCSRWRLSTSPVAPQAALWLSHAADSICARAGIDERLSDSPPAWSEDALFAFGSSAVSEQISLTVALPTSSAVAISSGETARPCSSRPRRRDIRRPPLAWRGSPMTLG